MRKLRIIAIIIGLSGCVISFFHLEHLKGQNSFNPDEYEKILNLLLPISTLFFGILVFRLKDYYAAMPSKIIREETKNELGKFIVLVSMSILYFCFFNLALFSWVTARIKNPPISWLKITYHDTLIDYLSYSNTVFIGILGFIIPLYFGYQKEDLNNIS